MDDRRLDTIARNLASGTSRRTLLAGLLGLGGLVAGGIEPHRASAARRGFSGPRFLHHGECSDELCETPTSCSSDYDCPGYAICCVGDCCNQGQSCVTDPNNNSYCA